MPVAFRENPKPSSCKDQHLPHTASSSTRCETTEALEAWAMGNDVQLCFIRPGQASAAPHMLSLFRLLFPQQPAQRIHINFFDGGFP